MVGVGSGGGEGFLRLSVLVLLAPLGEDGVGASVVLVGGWSVSYGV